jgi:hypothetical protein
MVNMYRKRCSTSLINKDMQIKTPVKCHCIPVRMAIIKKVSSGEGVKKREPLCSVDGNAN